MTQIQQKLMDKKTVRIRFIRTIRVQKKLNIA